MFGSHVTWYTESYRNLNPVALVGVWYTRSHKLFHIRKVRGVVRQHNNNNNNNNNNSTTMFMMLSSCHGHCESSPGSFDECRLSAGWQPTFRPSQLTWAVSPPINGCYHPHPPSPYVIITQPESWNTHFTVPRRAEGWVDLGTAGRVRSPCPRLYIAVAVVVNITGRGLSHRSQSCHR